MIRPGIVKDEGSFSDSEQHPLLHEDNGGEGPSGVPPAFFKESAGVRPMGFDDAAGSGSFSAGGDEPPKFTPYDAEHWISSCGDIISHDSHLNEDGV